MQIQISARHGNLSDRTQEAIRDKVSKLTRFFNRLTSIEITVNLEHRETPIVDLQVSAEHKHDFVATAEEGGLMPSLDSAVDKISQQLRKYKERLQDRHRSGHRQVEAEMELGAEPETE